ncbi:NYN domain-containing protein, partial [Candidatus Kaiserbacteria bacterium]|nr:NYN domain-containing protein [Candidatus Kaiserbacteria bacterium]
GILSSNGTSGVSARTLTGTANQITITNGDGTGGNPTFSLPSLLSFTNASTSQLSVFNKAYFGGTATSTFDSAGNLSVAGTLIVSGQCVTGDTKLRRRRRRKNAKGEWEEYFEDTRIDEIKAGDEIQSLDEKTGNLVWSRVKQLAFMGKKHTYRLTTVSGKTIRTTGNHPYLARKATSNARSLSRAVAFIDFANVKAGYRDRGYRTIDMEVLHNALLVAGITTTHFYYGTDTRNKKSASFFAKVASFGYAVITKPVQYFNISFLGLLQKPFNRRWIEALPTNLRTNLLREAERLDMIGVRLLQPKANFDVEITADALQLANTNDHFVLFSGDGDFVPLVKRLRELGKSVTVVSDRKYLSGELLLSADKFVTFGLLNKFVPNLLLGNTTQNPPRGRVLKKGNISIADLLGLSSVKHETVDNNVKAGEGSWRKVSELKEGMEIAIAAPHGGADWEHIVSVEPVAKEDVYDVEIEGTHNFIGNGIVAHNTAVFNQASTSQLSVFNKAYFGATATSTFDSTGALNLVNALTYGGVTLSNSVTGTGDMVLSSSPTLVTPTLGAASATSINKLTITTPATGSTLTILDGKTLTSNNTLTLAGTDSAVITFQGTDTYVGRATTDTFTNKTFDTAGTGNVFRINGTGITAVTGTGSVVLATSPTIATPTFTGLSSLAFASSTLFSNTGTAYFGGTATSTFSSTGSLTLPTTALLTAPYASTTMVTA